jgi:hypothetical protein
MSLFLTLGEDYRSIGMPKKYAGSPEIVWYDQVNKIKSKLFFLLRG